MRFSKRLYWQERFDGWAEDNNSEKCGMNFLTWMLTTEAGKECFKELAEDFKVKEKLDTPE